MAGGADCVVWKRNGEKTLRLEKVRKALEQKRISFEYFEEDGCGSIDFIFRGLKFHVWEFQENGIFGAETNIFNVGKAKDIEGDYEKVIADEIFSWPDMIA